MLDNKKTPCYGCQRRWATTKDNCHCSCEDYKRFSQEREKELEALRKKRNEEDMVTDVIIKSKEKTVKDWRRK